MNLEYDFGIAFILEGDTEKVFYLSLLQHLCNSHANSQLIRHKNPSTGKIFYQLSTTTKTILIQLYVVNTISQVTNSFHWFTNNCCKEYPSIKWHVFLCYDTDNYSPNISKFHVGDWCSLRENLSKNNATEIIDLAAQADIEDIMLIDYENVCNFIGIPPDTSTTGNKGKSKMKKLFRLKGNGCAYHEGQRAEALIQTLNFDNIINHAPIPLIKIKELCFT